MKLSSSQTEPGKNLDITVSSNPKSFVGLLGVDQSVLLLKKGNDIEPSTVFEEIEKYNEINKYNYDYSSSDYARYKDFETSNAIFLTNAQKPFSKLSNEID